MLRSNLLIILCLFSFESLAKDFKSLSCSKNETLIFFINGMKYKDTQYFAAMDSLNSIVNMNKNKFDQVNTTVDGVYNTSESFIIDFYQLAKAKIEEGNRLNSPLTFKMLMTYMFNRSGFMIVYGNTIELIKKLTAEELILAEKAKYNQVWDLENITTKVSAAVLSNRKVIIVSHSQGNMFANNLHDELLRKGIQKEKLDKFVGNLQVGSTAGHFKFKNHRVFSLKGDAALNLFKKVMNRKLVPQNYQTKLFDFCLFTGPFESPDLCHDLVNVYLSDSLSVIGPKQGSKQDPSDRTSRKIFIDNLEEVAWMLANNDENCCEGRDGRFYRKDYDSKPQKGFLEKTVSVDKLLNLDIDKDSQICGNVSLVSSDPNFKIKLEKTMVVADGFVELKGNLFLVDTIINSFENTVNIKINGTTDRPIYMEDTTITGKMNVSGNMVLDNSHFSGDGDLKGTLFHRIFPTGESWYSPTIKNANVSGTTNIQGVYNIERDLNDTTVNGRGVNTPNGAMSFTNIAPYPFHINKGNISGLMYLGGRVDYNVTIEGIELISSSKSDYSGINLTGSSELHTNANVKGTAYINGSKFSGFLYGNSFDPAGTFMHLSASNVYTSNLSGAPYIAASTHTGSIISGHPVVIGGSYVNTRFSCDAKVYSESSTGRSFGCGYVTETDKHRDTDPIGDYSEATIEWENWIIDKEEDIMKRF